MLALKSMLVLRDAQPTTTEAEVEAVRAHAPTVAFACSGVLMMKSIPLACRTLNPSWLALNPNILRRVL
jgi:hypothetical protein